MRTSAIDGTSQVGDARRKSTRRSTADGTFALLMADASPVSAEAAVASGPAVSIEALLTLQTAGNDAEAAVLGRALAYGGDVLDRLERLRVDLLEGAVPMARLTELAQTVRAHRVTTADARVNAILDEIELRAGVELAKLERRR